MNIRWSSAKDRYVLDDEASDYPEMSIKKELGTINYKEMNIIEGDVTYSSEKIVFKELDASGALLNKPPSLEIITKPEIFPKRDFRRHYFDISETLFFKIDHIPLSVKLELLPLLINGVQVPLPVCYFERCDLYRNTWMSAE